MNNKKITNQKAITLIALVITIVVLIILAGVAISLTLNQNGIFNKAKEARRLQLEAEYREKIGTDILDAQIDAIARNEELEDAQVKDIISKYGELQEDGDTIKIKDNDIQVSLKDIYNGTTSSTGGSYTENKQKIAELEKEIEDIKKSLADAITKAGVETSSNSNIDTIVGNIDKVAKNQYDAGKNSSTLKVKTIGTGNSRTAATFSATGIENYQNLTASNFAVVVTGIVETREDPNLTGGSLSISYNPSTGVVSVSKANSGPKQLLNGDYSMWSVNYTLNVYY